MFNDMDGGICPDQPGGSPERIAGSESGKDDTAAVGGFGPHKHDLDDLDLDTGSNTDTLDPDRDGPDNGYLDETPPSSAFCSRSCSCDSCVNISLDFSNSSDPDLAHIRNTEQRIKESLAALSTSRYRNRHISESWIQDLSTLPRWTKFQSSRRVTYGCGFRVARRTPRSLRSQRSTSTQVPPKSPEDRSNSISEISSQGLVFEDYSQNQANPSARPQGNLALFDHMMTFDPASFVDTSSPRSSRSPQTQQSPKGSHPTLGNASLSAVPSTVETRLVSFNMCHENDYPPYLINNIPVPHDSVGSLRSPRASATHIHSLHDSDISISSNPATGQNTPSWKTSLKDQSHRSSNKSSRSASAASLRRIRSSLKSGHVLRHSESDTRVDTIKKKEHSHALPVEFPMKKRSHKSRRSHKIIATGQNTSGELPGRDASSFLRARDRHPAKPANAKGRVRQSDDELTLPPAPKTGHASSKKLASATGSTIIRRDVRHHPDSGVGSSASSTFSPSPRGPTNVHHYITKKRFERSGNSSGSSAQIHSNQRTSNTSGSNNLQSQEAETIPEVNEDPSKPRQSKENSQMTQRTSKTSGARNQLPPTPPARDSTCGHAYRNRSRPSARIPLSSDYKTANPDVPKRSDISRSQLERDFHNLLESLGFVCHPNEPGNSTECQCSSKELKSPSQQSPSLYSIPKASFLQTASQYKTTEPQWAPPPIPAVLLSDDPADPRRRTDLKAARHYLDHPTSPPTARYRSELCSKADANKSRSQSAEANRPEASMEEKAKPADQNAESRKNSSQSSVTRKKNRLPILSSVKPINLDQIRSIKHTVDNAIADQKIFVVYGAFPSIREALKSRGWIEKRPYPERKPASAESDPTVLRNQGSRELFQNGGVQTLQSEDPSVMALIESMSTNPNEIDFEEELTERAIVGRMLRNVDPNFIWTVKCEAMDWKRLKKRQLINRFPRAFFATKIGLSTFLRQMHWFSEEGISMTRFPRCYNICQADDMEAFVEDFRLTACLGVLKIVIDRFQKFGDAGVQDENGKVPKYAMEFAISRCIEYLVTNTHADLDCAPTPSVHCHQWDQFLAWSYELRADKGRFSRTCSEPSPQMMSDTAKDLIKRMSEVWPQLNLDGVLNIWILKPGAKSRGRGIHLINRLDSITEHVSPQHIRDARYVAQKYIERPLIIFGTKFDIRQWFLVTSVYPMTIWMYRESYLRFCSQSFSLTNMHESVHLCNNAVQAKYKNGKRDPALPDENMWDCYTFQTYLRALGRPELWDTVIYPGMRQGIIGTLLASQEHMDRRGDCFELFGADFMLTEDFNPWLIEINSCPCMAPSTSVTARMCAQCLEDVIKVVIDRRNDKNADTGRFELVYKQQIPPPPPYLGMSLSVRGRRVNNGSASNTNSGTASPGHSPKHGSRRLRRPASDAPRRRQRHPRIVQPANVGAARFRFKDKLSNDSESTVAPDADEVTTSGSETDSSSATTDVPTSTDAESRPPRTPTPTCPPSRMENLRCSHRPSAVAAMVAKQKARQRAQHNILAAVGHGVIQPSEDNHKKSMELLREWRQRARTSGLLARTSTNKLGSLSSANSAEMVRRMSSSSNGSALMAVGVTLNSLLR